MSTSDDRVKAWLRWEDALRQAKAVPEDMPPDPISVIETASSPRYHFDFRRAISREITKRLLRLEAEGEERGGWLLASEALGMVKREAACDAEDAAKMIVVCGRKGRVQAMAWRLSETIGPGIEGPGSETSNPFCEIPPEFWEAYHQAPVKSQNWTGGNLIARTRHEEKPDQDFRAQNVRFVSDDIKAVPELAASLKSPTTAKKHKAERRLLELADHELQEAARHDSEPEIVPQHLIDKLVEEGFEISTRLERQLRQALRKELRFQQHIVEGRPKKKVNLNTNKG